MLDGWSATNCLKCITRIQQTGKWHTSAETHLRTDSTLLSLQGTSTRTEHPVPIQFNAALMSIQPLSQLFICGKCHPVPTSQSYTRKVAWHHFVLRKLNSKTAIEQGRIKILFWSYMYPKQTDKHIQLTQTSGRFDPFLK